MGTRRGDWDRDVTASLLQAGTGAALLTGNLLFAAELYVEEPLGLSQR